MLVPLGVKILWFVLSLTGLLGCWTVFMALGHTIGSLWPAVLYCVGCTVLEGIFCLGMVWKMDPFAMPGRFCVAQSVLIALGSLLLTGVIAMFSYMTHKVVLKPKTWTDSSHESFNWRPAYALPTVLFPLGAVAVHIALVVKLESVRPAIEFYCDSSRPQWVRFLTYGGTPLLLSIPSLILSIKSVLRAQETYRHIKRSQTAECDMVPGTLPLSRSDSSDGYTNPFKRRMWSLNSRRELRRLKEKQSMDMQLDESRLQCEPETSSASSLRFSMSPFTSPISPCAPNTVHFRVPTKPPSSDTQREHSSPSPSLTSSGLSSPATLTAYSALNFPESSNDTIQIAEVERRSSPSHRLFYNPPSYRNLDSHLVGPYPASCELERSHDNAMDSIHDDIVGADMMLARSGNKGEHEDRDKSDIFELGEVKTAEAEETDGDEHTLSEEMGTTRALPKVRTHTKQFNNDRTGLPPLFRCNHRPPLPKLSCAIRRLILFQIAFILVQIIGGISTLVDIARRYAAPSPIGTHHFALLFAAWGPVMFFGSLRSIRSHILPQRTLC